MVNSVDDVGQVLVLVRVVRIGALVVGLLRRRVSIGVLLIVALVARLHCGAAPALLTSVVMLL